MKIDSVKIEDFGSIASGEVDFNALPKVVMVAGKLRSAGASSNGAGKSTLFNALVWCLFGKEMKKRPAGAVIRRGCARAVVTVGVTPENGKSFKVTRIREKKGTVKVLIDSKAVDTASGAQDDIERRIGFSYDQFTRTVVFGGDISSFCRMSPAERTRMLEELLGIQQYLRAGDLAKEQAAELDKELSVTAAAEAMRKTSLASSRRDLHDFLVRAGQSELNQQQDIANALAKHGEAAMNVYRLSYKVGVARAAAAKDQRVYLDAVEAWEKERGLLLNTIAAVQTKRSEDTSKRATAESEKLAADREIRAAEKAENSKTCPTCKRPFELAKKTVFDTKPLYARLREAEAAYAKRCAAVAETEKELIVLNAKLARLNADKPKPPEHVATHSRIEEELIAAEAKAEHLAEALRDLRNDDPSADLDRRISHTLKEIRRSMSEGSTVDDTYRAKRLQADALNFWARGMARDGIPGLLLESTAPLLNEAVKPLTDVLTDGAYTIRFTGGTTRGRHDFKVEASNLEGGDSYEDLSTGEHARVDLCVLFAIRALMASQAAVKCKQLFLDELADGLDDQGLEYAARLFRSGKLADQIVFISHSPVLQDSADAVITIDKRNGVARIKS